MKHAYLIMAHDNFYNLKVLLKLLDDERNDIYLHIDKRVLNWNPDEWSRLIHKAKLFFVKREKVYWGTYSQIEALKNLMHEASNAYHDYYHIISGADLPIKSQEEIDLFFAKNNNKEFVGFSKNFNHDSVYKKNFFVKYFRGKNKFITLVAKKTRSILISLQKFFKVNTMKNFNGEIQKGCDWYSLTDDALKYLLSAEPEFKKYFCRAMGPGEFFVQTILYNSDFKKNIYCLEDENIGSQRYIDWERGEPYTFRSEDIDLLMNSDLLFARKFHETIDKKVIDTIYNELKKDN